MVYTEFDAQLLAKLYQSNLNLAQLFVTRLVFLGVSMSRAWRKHSIARWSYGAN